MNSSRKDSTASPVRHSFTAEGRRALLKDYFSTKRGLSEVQALAARTTGYQAQRLWHHEQSYVRRSLDLQAHYVEGIPVLPLSRCPFTTQVLEHSVDHFDLDGLWWNCEAPARPEESLPPTYFALTGAVHLTGPAPWTPFLCKPGPEVPYVVPRLLQHPSIVAVLSSVAVGTHTGYVIAYFADPVPYDIPRINTWGTNDYTFLDERGARRWNAVFENPEDFDFELEPWISAGKLRWIALGDQTLTLHNTVAGCPYVGLAGRREVVRIQEGRVW